MKDAAVSSVTSVQISKIMQTRSVKLRLKMTVTDLKRILAGIATVILILDSSLFCRMAKKKPQCVICRTVLASESMLPNKLKHHTGSSHPQFINKPREFFPPKLNDLK